MSRSTTHMEKTGDEKALTNAAIAASAASIIDETTVEALGRDLIKKVREGDLVGVQDLLKNTAMIKNNTAVINYKDKEGKTPLYYAIDSEFYYIAKALIEAGAEGNIATTWGATALHLAAQKGLLHIAILLIKRGAELNSKNESGDTPLYDAINYRHSDIAKALVAAGAEVNIATTWEETALHVAAQKGLLDIATLLIEKGAELNSIDNLGATPLFYAICDKHSDMVKALIAAGADVTIVTKEGKTFLDLASTEELKSIICAAEYADKLQAKLRGNDIGFVRNIEIESKHQKLIAARIKNLWNDIDLSQEDQTLVINVLDEKLKELGLFSSTEVKDSIGADILCDYSTILNKFNLEKANFTPILKDLLPIIAYCHLGGSADEEILPMAESAEFITKPYQELAFGLLKAHSANPLSLLRAIIMDKDLPLIEGKKLSSLDDCLAGNYMNAENIAMLVQGIKHLKQETLITLIPISKEIVTGLINKISAIEMDNATTKEVIKYLYPDLEFPSEVAAMAGAGVSLNESDIEISPESSEYLKKMRELGEKYNNKPQELFTKILHQNSIPDILTKERPDDLKAADEGHLLSEVMARMHEEHCSTESASNVIENSGVATSSVGHLLGAEVDLLDSVS